MEVQAISLATIFFACRLLRSAGLSAEHMLIFVDLPDADEAADKASTFYRNKPRWLITADFSNPGVVHTVRGLHDESIWRAEKPFDVHAPEFQGEQSTCGLFASIYEALKKSATSILTAFPNNSEVRGAIAYCKTREELLDRHCGDRFVIGDALALGYKANKPEKLVVMIKTVEIGRPAEVPLFAFLAVLFLAFVVTGMFTAMFYRYHYKECNKDIVHVLQTRYVKLKAVRKFLHTQKKFSPDDWTPEAYKDEWIKSGDEMKQKEEAEPASSSSKAEETREEENPVECV